MVRIPLEVSNRGYPCIGAGGGAYTNTYEGRIIVDKDGNLKRPIYIKHHGPLACRTDQAIVPVEVGDIIVELSGGLPAIPESIEIRGYKITSIKDVNKEKIAECEEVFVSPDLIPESVFVGLNIYHNRDGSYFVS